MKKTYILVLISAIAILSIFSVSAGLLDGSSNAKSESIPMETQEIGGFFKISVPVGSNFVYDYETKYGPTYKNIGEYNTMASDIIYIPQDFDSSFPGQNRLYEEDGDITVYQDIGMPRLYYVDRHIDGHTISLMGFDNLDLLKEMARSVELV